MILLNKGRYTNINNFNYMPKGIKGFQKSEKHWNWQGGKITVKCPACNRLFKTIRSRPQKYCNRKCYKEHFIPWHKNKTGVYSQKTLSKFRLAKLGKPSLRKGKKFPQFSGKNHPNWRGGITKNPQGYILVRKPDHPKAINGYIKRSYLVMERKLGRFITKQEIVHHINLDKTDDRPENLMLFPNQSKHAKYHHQ